MIWYKKSAFKVNKSKPGQTLPDLELEAEENVGEEELGGESPKTPDYVYNPDFASDGPESEPEALTPPPPVSPGPVDVPSPVSSPIPSPPRVKEPEPVSTAGSISKVWSGKLVFPEASTFRANAYVISGSLSGSVAKNAFGKQMQIQGRMLPHLAGEVSLRIYLNKFIIKSKI